MSDTSKSTPKRSPKNPRRPAIQETKTNPHDRNSVAFALGDKPRNRDLLGYEPYVRAVAELLKGDNLETPFTLGIYGPWGTGKSTFMHLLNNELAAVGLNTVWFEPWQFEDKEEVWKALILTVIQYLEKLNNEADTPALEQSRKLTSLVKGVGKLALDKAIRSLSSDLTNLDELASLYAENTRDNTQFINTFRLEFEEVKAEILGTNESNPGKRLIIFVDDLDRCTPESCITVLEAIKLFFDLDECVFVLGIDSEVVQKGVEYRYKDSIKIRGQDYLEKIIQLPFSLPPISEDSFQTFFDHSTKNFQFDDNSKKLIIRASGQNPRRAIRLSNCLNLVKKVAAEIRAHGSSGEETDKIDNDKLALLLVIQVRFPMVFHWLANRPILLGNIRDHEDHKKEIAARLDDVYGPALARETADEFYGLLDYALSECKIADFASIPEMNTYLRITSVVEEVQEVPGRSLRQVIDERLRPAKLSDEILPPTENGNNGGEEKSGADSDAIVGPSVDAAQEALKRWDELRQRRLRSLIVANLQQYEDQAREIVHLMETAKHELARQADRTQDEENRFRYLEMLARLERVRPSAITDTLRSLPVWILVVGLGIGLLACAAFLTVDFYSVVMTSNQTVTPETYIMQISVVDAFICTAILLIFVVPAFLRAAMFNRLGFRLSRGLSDGLATDAPSRSNSPERKSD